MKSHNLPLTIINLQLLIKNIQNYLKKNDLLIIDVIQNKKTKTWNNPRAQVCNLIKRKEQLNINNNK